MIRKVFQGNNDERTINRLGACSCLPGLVGLTLGAVIM